MNDTARSYQTQDPASTDGIDDLFEQGLLESVEDSSEPLQGVLVQREGLPVEVAAIKLGLSVSGVLKRLRKGALPGFKVPSKRGAKWLVSPEALTEGLLLQVEESSFESEGVLVECEESSIELPQQLEESSFVAPTEPSLFEELKLRTTALEAQLQAATWRNGYLEAMLEAERNQVKLLTDSQHKLGLWAKLAKLIGFS